METCKFSNCPTSPTCRGYCELHFLKQYVAPLQKERSNLVQALSTLDGQIRYFMTELGAAKERLAPIGRDNHYNGYRIACHKCGKGGFGSGIETILHENDCKGPQPSRTKRAADKSTAQPKAKIVDAMEDIENNI